jgi:hypothetical protein
VTSDEKRARLTLYSRAWCHLCEDMLTALEGLRSVCTFEVAVVDIDGDPDLSARYDELVPVLEAEGLELSRYRLDEAKVREYLGRFR